ncbi:dipeptide ABC transporter ATP-binding protein [Nocardioides sp. AN3]
MTTIAEALPDRGPSRTAPILRVEGLVKVFGGSKRRPGTRVLHGVDLEIGRGETLGLVGESGSGKSTTGRCIVRLTDPTEGSVLFDGVDLAALGGERLRTQRRRIQMVFQDPASSLDSRMTVLQSVVEPLHVHGIGKPAEREGVALAMLERVGLVDRLCRSKPHMLSGGQQQRAAIARALVTEPDLVILDEPVSALDVSVRAQVLNLLKDLQRERGLSYLFIVHDLAIAEYFSDRVMVMYGGQIMESGPAEDLFRAPSHPYTQALLSAVPLPDPRVRPVEQPPPMAVEGNAPRVADSGCAFANRCLLRAGRDRCAEQAPELRPGPAGHLVACHFSDEITDNESETR